MACDKRQGGEEKGVSQIEVTTEMVDAGLKEMELFGRDYLNDIEIVTAVYLSMAKLASGFDRTPS